MPQAIGIIVAGVSAFVAVSAPIIASYGAILTKLAFGILTTLVTDMLGPKIEDVGTAAGQDLALSPSTEGPIVPLVFGRGTILPNLIRYEKGSLYHVKIIQTIKRFPLKNTIGSKLFRPKKITIGRRDFASFELAICMGSVDVIDEIIMLPGSENVLSRPVVFSENEYKRTVHLKSKTGHQKGYVDIYRGSTDQERGSDYYSDKWGTDGITSETGSTSKPALNYKNVCFAVFKKFECGQTSPGGGGVPIPTFKFRVRKYPKLSQQPAGMHLQGSNDQTSESELDVNPVAVAYEALTSSLIGPEVDDSLFNLPSFVRSSQVFAEYNQGVSLAITRRTSVKDLFDALKNNSRMLSYWDGWQVAIRSYYDSEAFYSTIRTLTVDDLDSVDIQLGTIKGTINVLKVRYTDINNRSKQAVVTRQNLSNISLQDGKRVDLEIDGRGLTNAESANRLAEIALQEGSYSSTAVTIKGNMSLASIAPMDILAIKWVINNQNTVLYVRVGDVKPDRTAQSVTINALQDPNLNPEISDEIATEAKLPSWSSIKDLKSSDRKPEEEEDLGALPFKIVSAFELPPQLTGRSGTSSIPLFQARQSNFLDAKVYKQVNDGVAEYLGDFPVSGVSGYFKYGLPADTADIIESPIPIVLSEPELDSSKILSGAQIVTSPNDDNFTDLIDSNASIIIAGDEIMAVGLVEETNGSYTMNYVMRGLYGTTPRNHDIGTTWFWYEDAGLVLQSGLTISEDIGEEVKILSYASTSSSTTVAATAAYHSHFVNDLQYIEEGVLPMTPILNQVTPDGGQLYTLSLVPILASNGAGISEELVTSIGDLDYEIKEYSSTGDLLNAYLMNGTFVPGDNTSEAGGLVSKQLDVTVSTTYLEITTISNGLSANESLTVSLI
jgi:hypothetical protein